jgi:peptidoglycan-associated lipoprotein
MVKLFLSTLLLCTISMFSGCRKQVSTLQDISVEKAAVPVQTDLFKGVDTSDEVSFIEAQLVDDMAENVRKSLQVIYFQYNSFLLSSDATEKLAVAAAFLNENAGLRVLIEGHCDERGSSEYNMGLGERRALAVKEYLLNYGIKSVRIEITTLGKEQPASVDCRDEECHSLNRRSAFKVLAR